MRKTLFIVAALAAAACKGPQPTEKAIDLAKHYCEHQRWSEAAAELKPIVDAAPSDWKVNYWYGIATTNLGELNTARAALELAATAKPNNVEVAVAFAEVLYRQKEYPKLYALLRSTGAAMSSPVAYNALAGYAEQIGDYDTALNATNSAIQVDDGLSAPVRAETYVQAGMLLARIQKSDEAIRRFRQAYGLNPQNMIAIEQLKARGVAINDTTALPPGL